jgi:hypothetical protein
MVIGNLVYERGLTQYIVVHIVALIVVSGLALLPLNAGRRRAKQHDGVIATKTEALHVR